MIFACLPVKSPAQAKGRLRHFLTDSQREQLARAMFEDVLIEALKVRGIDRLVVVSNDAQALVVAAAAGATVLVESEQQGHGFSADWAATECMKRGATSLMLIPIDVPLVRAAELEMLLEAARELPQPNLVIVPSADGTGTNAMLRTPPNAIDSRFGPDSLEAHLAQAKTRNVHVHTLRPEGLLLDLDEPADLFLFLSKNPQGRTADFLRSIRSDQLHPEPK